VLVAHRRDLLQDQTRRAARLREVLLSVFPGLEAVLDLKRVGALVAVTKVAKPAAEAKAALVAEIASEMLRTRERIAELDRRLEKLLANDPAARIVRTMPGMGIVFTAEFQAEIGDLGRFASADSLAAAAGVTPVLRASGATSYRRRARRGNKVLKRVLYRSAFSCISHHKRSEAFYRKKRAEDKGHHQAVTALARRRVDVLWAMLRDGQTYSERPSLAA